MGAAVKPIRSGPARLQPPKRKSRTPLGKARAHEIAWQQVSPLLEAARHVAGCTFVYFIGESDDGPVKIGFAKDPIARLRQMQTGNPRRLRIEYVLVGDMELEKVLQEMWEPFAIYARSLKKNPDANPGTEWFRGEIRAQLFPVLHTAVEQQIALLQQGIDITPDDMERIARNAHGQHDVIAWRRDEIRLLGAGGGIVTQRSSRI